MSFKRELFLGAYSRVKCTHCEPIKLQKTFAHFVKTKELNFLSLIKHLINWFATTLFYGSTMRGCCSSSRLPIAFLPHTIGDSPFETIEMLVSLRFND